MKLLEYINILISDTTKSKADINDYKGVRKSITHYLGDLKDTDILRLTQERWIEGYIEYMTNTYQSNKPARSEAQRSHTANRYLKSLRKIAIAAIATGVLPAIDIFKGTSASELARKRAIASPAVESSIKTLITSHSHIDYSWEDTYLMSIYCSGMEVKDLKELDIDDFDTATCSIRLPHLGASVPYPKMLFGVIYDYVSSGRNKLANHNEIARGAKAAGNMLYRGQSIFTDWANLIIESKLDIDLRRIIALKLAKNRCPKSNDINELSAVANYLDKHYNKYRKYWYAIKSRCTSAEEVVQRLTDGAICSGIFGGRKTDIYVPYLKKSGTSRKRNDKAKVANQASVLRNLLFYRAYPYESLHICRTLDIGKVLSHKISGINEPIVIPYHEIYTLQLVLQSIDNYSALQMMQDEAIKDKFDNTPLSVGDTVRVMMPGYEAYTACVLKVKGDGAYDLEVIGTSYRLKLQNIPRALIRNTEGRGQNDRGQRAE